MPAQPPAFQDLIPDNGCFGCGPHNPGGLHLKSRWDGDAAVCTFQGQPHHSAGPPNILNGGIIATVIDCHSVCTAIADAYRREARVIGSDPALWYATGKLAVSYRAPVPLDRPVLLRAVLGEVTERKTVVACTLEVDGSIAVQAEVLAVRVPPQWRHGR